MKKAISIVLLLTVAAPALLKFSSAVNYVVEYDYYVNVLCENKDKPELKCNGTCHLAKELKQAEEATTPPEVPSEVKFEIVVFHEMNEKDEVETVGLPASSIPLLNIYKEPFPKVNAPPPEG